MSAKRCASLVLLLACAGCSALRIATGPKWSERQPPSLPAAIADHVGQQRLRFLVFGDAGTGGPDQKRVAVHMAQECSKRGGCDFALMLGDNIYRTGVAGPSDRKFAEKFEKPYEPLGHLDFWAVAGNHDWYRRGSVDNEVLYTQDSVRWRMPAHDYAVPLLPSWLHIYGLETTKIDRGRLDGQLDRAREALCGREGWRLLFGHHAVYTSGVHGDARGVMPKVRESLLEPLIEACEVQIYFAGHDHHQEHLSAPAFDQVVQGAAGKLRRVKAISDREAGVQQLTATSRYGFALVEATPDTLEIQFFGYGPNSPYQQFHCRFFERESFTDRLLRSRPCQERSDR